MAGKVWQARFSSPLAPEIDSLNRSALIDWVLWPHDLEVSRVWARALQRADLLPDGDLSAILVGLDQVGEELDADGVGFIEDDDEALEIARDVI